MKIAITTSSFAQFSDEPLKRLYKAGIEYVLNQTGRRLSEPETIELLNDCIGVAAGTELYSARILNALPQLKVISRCGSGMDNVDREHASRLGIRIFSTPDGPTLAVAELTLAYVLDLLRMVTQMDRELRSGQWKKRMGYNLRGKRLGIIGLGRIGHAVAEVFCRLGVEVAFNDPAVESNQYKKMSFNDLLKWADILSLHCSASGGNGPLLTVDQLEMMRPGSWVVNASRGGLIDEDVLHKMLKSGRLNGAAIDVFSREPYHGPLTELDNVILTPHIGSYARESRIQMEIDTIQNLIEGLR